jgi:hypothetical protein
VSISSAGEAGAPAGEEGAGDDEREELDATGWGEEEEEEEEGNGVDPNEILDADSDSTLDEELAAAAVGTHTGGQRALRLVVEGNQLAKVLWFSCNAQLIPQAVLFGLLAGERVLKPSLVVVCAARGAVFVTRAPFA